MELNGRQIRQPRSLANRFEATVGIGKAGITDAVVHQMDNALEAHKLVKCSAQRSASMGTREAAIALPVRPIPPSSRPSAIASCSTARSTATMWRRSSSCTSTQLDSLKASLLPERGGSVLYSDDIGR
jgi:hypothetical protein